MFGRSRFLRGAFLKPYTVLPFLVVFSLLHAQSDFFWVTGIVRDAQSQQVLPNANIRLIGTTRGATTNNEGRYQLLLPAGEHKLMFSYLGYQSDTVRVRASDQNLQYDVLLQPSPILLPEVVVVGDVRDPAEEIIRRAIAKKRETLALLHAYQFTAYTKLTGMLTAKHADQPDSTSRGFVFESSTQGYWKSPNYYKEEITARKQSAILPAEFNLLTARHLPNLNDDRTILYNRKIVGPTAPDAFDFYSYRMLDTLAVNNTIVWRIKMTPKSTIIPLFEGTISIADSSYLVMEVDVHGNDALNEPPFTEIELRQQFALYEDRFWLPIQCTISFIPRWGFTGRSTASRVVQTSVFSDYKVNLDLSTSDFDQISVRVRPTADRVDSLTWSRLQAIPLTADEKRSYLFWDSVRAIRNWRRDLALFLITTPLEYQRLPLSTFSDFYRFNRVEGSAFGVGLDSKEYLGTTRLTFRVSYGVEEKRGRYGIGVEQQLTRTRTWAVGGEIYRALKVTSDRRGFSPFGVTLTSLFSKIDPLDYYDAQGWSLFLRWSVLPFVVIEARAVNEEHRSVQLNTNFSIFKRSASYRPNPAIDEGKLHGSALKLAYDSRKYIDSGLFRLVDEAQESWFIETLWEYSSRGYFGSDFEFGRASVQFQRRQFTFGTGTLAIYANLGWSTGSLPLQRHFISSARIREIGTAGSLKTVGPEGIMGTRLAILQVEHDFGSMFFRSLGIEILNNLHFKLYLGSAWSSDNRATANIALLGGLTANRVFHEAGFGLRTMVPVPFALDFTWRLTHRDGDNFAITLGSALF